jgi:hypothetical protein
VIGQPIAALDNFVVEMEREFRMKRLGDIVWYSNIHVERSTHSDGDSVLKMSQSAYIMESLKELKLDQTNIQPTPMAEGVDIHELSERGEPMTGQRHTNFRGKLGKTMWCMQTHPEVAYAVCQLSRVANCATEGHEKLIDHVWRYLKGVHDRGIFYRSKPYITEIRLVGWSDSNWGGDSASMKSTTSTYWEICEGYIMSQSKLQSVVAMSTMEAEIIALSSAIQEAILLRGTLKELGFPQEQPTTIYVDNAATVAWANSSGNYSGKRSVRHMELRHAHIKESVQLGDVAVIKCATKDNKSDIGTKALGPADFRRHLDTIIA